MQVETTYSVIDYTFGYSLACYHFQEVSSTHPSQTTSDSEDIHKAIARFWISTQLNFSNSCAKGQRVKMVSSNQLIFVA